MAQLRVTRGTVEPLPIAIPEFSAKHPRNRYGAQHRGLISADLARSGLFRPIDRRAFIQQVSALRARPRFGDWRQTSDRHSCLAALRPSVTGA